MYEAFFGLSEKPFSIQPDPAFLYWGRGHRLAYAMLEYGVLNHAGISVITGEVGCGKTTLIHRLLDQLANSHTIALLSNIQQGRGDLLSWVLMGYGQPYAAKSPVELFSQLQSFFIGEYAKGKRVILIIDEAQNLSAEQLEELRLLSNINAGKDQLLQLILVGQPQLKDLLSRPDMLQLAQRIGSDFHLTPLSRDEVDAYIETRLTIAGATERIFTEHAVDMVAAHSKGVPRVINVIADTALVYAFSAQEKSVDAETVASVVRDKLEYGVFGLATRGDPASLRPPAEGPRAFIRPEPEEPAPPHRQNLRPTLVSRNDDPPPDAPRMTAGVRGPRIAAASAIQPAREPEAKTPPASQLREEAPAPSVAVDPVRPVIVNAPLVKDAETAAKTESAPNVRAQEVPAPAPLIGVVVVSNDAAAPASTIESLTGAACVVYAPRSEDKGAEEAKNAGANLADPADTPGRRRNAGYRLLKRLSPRIEFVQFLEAGETLEPGWLDTASRFLERRREVALLEGLSTPRAEALAPVAALSQSEIHIAGRAVFVRAAAFEEVGGFRGDLPTNETSDLCVRLRRRGAHIWRLDSPMVSGASARASFSERWRAAVARGYDYAHGASLHGAPPERLFVQEQSRALFWGGAFPLMGLVVAAACAGVAAFVSPALHPLLVFALVIGLAMLVYLGKIISLAISGVGFGRAFALTAAHAPEFIGAWRFHMGGAPPKASDR